MEYRDRVLELRRVRAADIAGAPWNWRRHPDAQVEALAGSIEELGFIDPLDTRELPDGRLELIDGHARLYLLSDRIGPDTIIPCIVTDLSEAEAKKANLFKDPLAAMAEADGPTLEALLREVEIDSPALDAMLNDLAADAELGTDEPADEPPADDDVLIPERYQVLIECRTESEQADLLTELAGRGLKVRSLIS
jgi:ParB-like chromosome segregation protein Spo0J